MKRFGLRPPQFLHPLWFNNHSTGIHSAVVNAGVIDLDGVQLTFMTEDRPEDGTPVRVWLSGNFYCQTVADYDAGILTARTRESDEKERLRLRANEDRDKAVAFNRTIRLPIQWDVDQKVVLSGLSEGSFGDGAYRNTVYHILCLEELACGRLKRRSGDFLCTAASRTNGAFVSSRLRHKITDGEGQLYTPRVTCKACLRLAARFGDSQ